jgi:DNA-binding NarL/FixJ family response regulator
VADQALDAGARGIVAIDDVESRLAPTVRAVVTGQLVIPAEFRRVTGRLLSAREKQVLSMVVLGFTNVDIANQLFVAESTVKSHLNSAYRKLGVRSRQQATARILDSADGLGLGILSLTEAPAIK